MTWLALASAVLQGSQAKKAGGSSASAASGITGGPVLGFDNSGWNVNFGAGSVASDRQQAGTPGAALAQSASPLLMIGGVILLAALAWQRL